MIYHVVPDFVPANDCASFITSTKRDLSPHSGNVLYLPLDRGFGAETAGRVARELVPEPVAPETVLVSTILPPRTRWPFVHTDHADNVLRDGRPNHTPHRAWSAILYLSSCGGGELVFTDLGARVTPAPGLLAVFPADVFHHTTPVTSGERHSLAMWFKRQS
jgi:hypothetical protein